MDTDKQGQVTTEQVSEMNRNPMGRGGFGEHPENINAGGRPKNSLKSYQARKFAEMSDEEKEKWLNDNKILGIDRWKMSEGNPSNETELKGSLTISQVLDALENGPKIGEQDMENK